MQFRIHNEGWIYFIFSTILTIISFPFFPIFGFLLLILTCYIYYFFRDPVRYIPVDDFIMSPADGVITFIGETIPPIDIDNKDRYIKVSIFLNIFNVHVNRIPTNGIVKKIKYIHGKFINATLDKSSDDNERNIILIEKKNSDTIITTQIAGLIARRIVCDLRENQEVFKGDRFGIIKFGSRVDLYMPIKYKILVSLGQIVVGGETIISNPLNIQEISESNRN